jgi:hypothetical protein
MRFAGAIELAFGRKIDSPELTATKMAGNN